MRGDVLDQKRAHQNSANESQRQHRRLDNINIHVSTLLIAKVSIALPVRTSSFVIRQGLSSVLHGFQYQCQPPKMWAQLG